jgi:glutamate decarboxylase
VYPGVGWVVWRDPAYLPQELVFNINYLGADQASFTLNFSRGASQIIGQYYQLIRLGKRGYRRVMLNLTRIADYLAAHLAELGFVILSQGKGTGLPLVAARLDPAQEKLYDEFAVAHALREHGWVVPAYTMAPHSDKMKLMRIVVREDFTKSRADALIADFKLALQTLDKLDEAKLKERKEIAGAVKRRATIGHGKGKGAAELFGDDHSLQGQHDKTHAVC